MNARLLAACALLAIACPAWALDPAYLSEWPAVERVLADHQGDNSQDTMARQMAALHILRISIEEMAGPRRWHGLTADEVRLQGLYYAGAEQIRGVVNTTLSNELGPGFHGPFAKPPLREWYALQWDYESDPAFRAATLQRYLPPPQLEALGAQAAVSGADNRQSREQRNGLRLPLVAIAAVIALLVVWRMWRRRAATRRAQRRPALETPVGYDPVATEPRQRSIDAAAIEILDSLEPYMMAARRQGPGIPIGVFGDREIVGFLSCYARRALEAVAGSDPSNVNGEADSEVLTALLHGQHARLARIFDGRTTLPGGALESDERVAFTKGEVIATLALAAFGSEDTDLSGHDQRDAQDPEPGIPILQDDPPPTRLHPRGPGAELGQHIVLNTFARRLAKLAKEMS